MFNFGFLGLVKVNNFINFGTKLFEVISRLAKLIGNVYIYMLHKKYIYTSAKTIVAFEFFRQAA